MSDDKILLLHPQGKSGRNISLDKYDLIKQTMIKTLSGRQLTHTQLFEMINQALEGKFEGNISWYSESVKLDLEARGVIERTADKPQRYQLVTKS